MYYIKKPPTPSILMAAMKKVRPTIMCAVPLIIEKVYKNSVVPTVEKSRTLSWMREKMPRVLYWLVGKKLYKSFGGKLKFFGIGGSKLDSTVEDFLNKARFPYAIGYGLTETAPLITNAASATATSDTRPSVRIRSRWRAMRSAVSRKGRTAATV